MGRFAVAERDGDRCSDNRTRLGLARLPDARGSRRAVAVPDGCREISRKRVAQNEPQTACRFRRCEKLHVGAAREPSRPG